MNHAVILDISSDEEVAFDDAGSLDNFDWISNFLEDVPSRDEVNCNKIVDDDGFDDVVVVGEVLRKPKRKASLPGFRNVRFDEGDDDDHDCVVLTSDPDKPATDKEVEDGKGSDDDSDDLVIVGEKGQVACRDYPHSRHLCAKFPFSSTAHESHCELCHCFVCDLPAPCVDWVSGDSSLDHCHATDKIEHWQLERKRIRQLKNPAAAVANPVAGSISRLPQLQQTSARCTPVPTPSSTSGVSSSFGLPNIIRPSWIQRSSVTMPRNRFQTRQVAAQYNRSCNSATYSRRSSTLAPNSAAAQAQFKRSGFTSRRGTVNLSAHIPPNNMNGSSYWQQMLNHPLVGNGAENNSVNLTDPYPSLNVNISPLVSCSISTGKLASNLQNYSNPVAQEPSLHSQGYSQSTVVTGNSPWVYSSGSQPYNDASHVPHFSTSNTFNNVTPSTHQSTELMQNGSGLNLPSNSLNVMTSSTPRIHQPVEASQNFSSSGLPYNTSISMNDIAQSFQNQPTESSQVEDAVSGQGVLSSIEHNPQTSGSMSTSLLEFDLDNWLPEIDPVLGASGCDLFNLSDQPSVPASVDTGMLYF